jgi:hypothetical protein
LKSELVLKRQINVSKQLQPFLTSCRCWKKPWWRCKFGQVLKLESRWWRVLFWMKWNRLQLKSKKGFQWILKKYPKKRGHGFHAVNSNGSVRSLGMKSVLDGIPCKVCMSIFKKFNRYRWFRSENDANQRNQKKKNVNGFCHSYVHQKKLNQSKVMTPLDFSEISILNYFEK